MRLSRRPLVRSVLACSLAASALGTNGVLLAQTSVRQVDGFGVAPASRMHALLQRTFLKIDVLTLDLCFDASTGRVLARAITDHAGGSRDRADAIAEAAVSAYEAVGIIEFKRGIKLEQFLDGAFRDHERAVAAGFLADSTRQALGRTLGGWYGFLKDRGILEGDRILYRFYPHSVRTTYQGGDGRLYMDRVSLGDQRRASVLGAYFAPGSSLREPLIGSLEMGESALTATRTRCRILAELPPPGGAD